VYAAGATVVPSEDVLGDALFLIANPGWTPADLEAAPADLVDVIRMARMALAKASHD
jgi:hypothetical protein